MLFILKNVNFALSAFRSHKRIQLTKKELNNFVAITNTERDSTMVKFGSLLLVGGFWGVDGFAPRRNMGGVSVYS